jgi:hypothetical protein
MPLSWQDISNREQATTMQPMNPGSTPKHLFERSLALAGAVICPIITIPIWVSISAQQPMWPLPGLYLLEMVTLSTVGAVVFVRNNRWNRLVTWGVVGVLIAFSILGAFSVGFFYLPTAIFLGAAALLSDIRENQPIFLHLGICALAGIAQVVLMLGVIRLFQ